MVEERKKILEMLSEGKINAEEAEKLLDAISTGSEAASTESTIKAPRYLRVMVEPGPESEKPEKVNIRVPLKLIRAGLRLAGLIPRSAQAQVNDALHEKGIDVDFSNIKPGDLDDIIRQIDDLTVDVEGKETVKIFCE